MKRVLGFCADLLFPRRCPFCDAVTGFSGPCASCEPELQRLRCAKGQAIQHGGHNLDHIQSAWAPYFYEGIVRKSILRMKFEERTDLVFPLAQRMTEFLKSVPDTVSFDCIVPVPSARKEEKNRGYDVPQLIAEQIGQETGIPVMQLLVKTRESTRQMTLSGEERRKNLRGVFAAADPENVRGRSVLIVDDVITTGTTVNECAKTLKQAGAECCCALGTAVTR